MMLDISDIVRCWLDIGQKYFELKDFANSKHAYTECMRLCGRDEEAWYAALRIAECTKCLGDEPGYIDGLLAAYDMRPHRVEPLLSLSAHLRECGQHRLGMLIAKKASAIPLPPSDHLFLDPDAYAYETSKEFYIHAFFAGSPDDKRAAAKLCHRISIDRNAPKEVRRTSRHNTVFFAPDLAEIAPSFMPRKIAVTDSVYPPMNPSIAVWRDRLWLCVRRVNYAFGDGSYYTITPSGDLAEKDENHRYLSQIEITKLDSDLQPIHWRKVVPVPNLPFPDVRNSGLEDMRLNPRADGLWFSATCCETRRDGVGKMLVGRFTEEATDDRAPVKWRVASRPGKAGQWEKNWMPFIGRDRFLYSVDPTVVVDRQGKDVCTTTPAMALDHLRGGTQLIPFTSGMLSGWLGITHESTAIGDNRHYLHRFLLLDDDGAVQRVSPAFRFGSGERIEFAAGLCQLPRSGKLVITYGVMDREAWLATVDTTEIAALLNEDEGIAV